MPNLLHNLIDFFLTGDQSDPHISNLEVEMSEATNSCVVSFAQDLIPVYDIRRNVQTHERIGLVVLLKKTLLVQLNW
jgi:hypothetical protein